MIRIGPRTKALGDEKMSGNRAHRIQDPDIRDVSARQLMLYHGLAFPGLIDLPRFSDLMEQKFKKETNEKNPFALAHDYIFSESDS